MAVRAIGQGTANMRAGTVRRHPTLTACGTQGDSLTSRETHDRAPGSIDRFQSGSSSSRNHLGRMTPAQQAQISNGSQVFIAKDVPGAPWPRAWVYQRVESTAEEAAAVFADYEGATSFARGLDPGPIKHHEVVRRQYPLRTAGHRHPGRVLRLGGSHLNLRPRGEKACAGGAARYRGSAREKNRGRTHP